MNVGLPHQMALELRLGQRVSNDKIVRAVSKHRSGAPSSNVDPPCCQSFRHAGTSVANSRLNYIRDHGAGRHRDVHYMMPMLTSCWLGVSGWTTIMTKSTRWYWRYCT